MEIIHINRNFFTNRIHENIIKALKEDGYRNLVFVYHYGEYREKAGTHSCINLILVPKILRLTPFIRSLFVAFSIKKALSLKKKELDLEYKIHAHTLCSDGIIALILSNLLKRDFICTVRNSDINGYLKKVFFLRPLIRYVAKKAKKILLLTPAYEEKLKKYNIFYPDKTVLLPSFIDSYWHNKSFKSEEKSRKSNLNELKIVYVGSLIKEKRVVELISYCLKKQLNLDIYGMGELSEEAEKLSRLSKGKINCFGRVNNHDLPSILAAYDVLLSFSPYESFGLIFLEAMLCGVIPIFARGEGIDGFFPWNNLTVDVFNESEVDWALSSFLLDYDFYQKQLTQTNFEIFNQEYFIQNYREIMTF